MEMVKLEGCERARDSSGTFPVEPVYLKSTSSAGRIDRTTRPDTPRAVPLRYPVSR